MKPRIEFVYDRKKNLTTIFVWNGQQIIDKLEMNDQLSSYSKKKIRQELTDKYQD